MLKGFVSGEEKDIVRIPMKGKNLWNASFEQGGISNQGYEVASETRVRAYIDLEAGAEFTFSSNQKVRMIYAYNGVNRVSPVADYGANMPTTATFIVPVGANRVGIALLNYNGSSLDIVPSDVSNIMLNLGSAALPYEPYGYQEGWEVRDNQDRLIWGREDVFEGTDSIPIKGCGTPLTSVTINGNGQQNGTPSPQNILPFDGTGERTGNLYANHHNIYAYIDSSGNVVDNSANILAYEKVESNTTYTVSADLVATNGNRIALFTDMPVFGSVGSNIKTISNQDYEFTITTSSDTQYIAWHTGFSSNDRLRQFLSTSMLVSGSTAPTSYIPYGWQIPLTCAGQTTPLYLGEVSTVRRIKKLVFDGTEGWNIFEGSSRFFYMTLNPKCAGTVSSYFLCTHRTGLQAPSTKDSLRWYDNDTVWSDVASFKAWLATEYAAGHPVTVWYVLATEQTGIVNEPLYRIGDYCDTLTTTTPIPTTTGATDVTVDTKIPPSELTIKVHAKKIRYGFKIDKSQENSESAVIYTHDAVTMTPAVMDFTNDRFSYGSWENAWFVRDARPCALKLDGTVAYYLDPNDATKKLDGTASDIYYELLSTEPADWSTQWKQYYTKSGDDYMLNDQAEAPTFATNTYYKLTYNSSFTGNFMVEFPQVWFYRHEDTSYNYIEISNYKLSDDWKCYSHINKDGTLVSNIYLPMFKGVIKDSKLRSLPGQIPQGKTSATTEVDAATALGSRWQIWDHSSIELINDLLTLMSKSIDSQGRFGQGRSTGYDSADTVTYGKLQSGTLIKKGKFHGYSATTKEVKVFGIEGFWANRWDRLQGMLLVNNVWKIKMTPPYNFTGTDFVTLSNAEVPSGNGYLSKVQTSEYGSIPASIANGSSTKYFKDYFYKTATDTRVAVRGGNCGSGGGAGFRCVYVNNAASYSGWSIGASPVYK